MVADNTRLVAGAAHDAWLGWLGWKCRRNQTARFSHAQTCRIVVAKGVAVSVAQAGLLEGDDEGSRGGGARALVGVGGGRVEVDGVALLDAMGGLAVAEVERA